MEKCVLLCLDDCALTYATTMQDYRWYTISVAHQKHHPEIKVFTQIKCSMEHVQSSRNVSIAQDWCKFVFSYKAPFQLFRKAGKSIVFEEKVSCIAPAVKPFMFLCFMQFYTKTLPCINNEIKTSFSKHSRRDLTVIRAFSSRTEYHITGNWSRMPQKEQ